MPTSPWETIVDDDYEQTARMRTPNGWLVRSIIHSCETARDESGTRTFSVAMTTVDDPAHRWDPTKEEEG